MGLLPAWRPGEVISLPALILYVGREKILATVLHGARNRKVKEAMDTLTEGPGGFYKFFTDDKTAGQPGHYISRHVLPPR